MRLFLSLLSAFASLALRAAAPGGQVAADTIVGRWLTANKTGIIQVYQQQGLYGGKIVGPENPPRVDEHNPDPALRRRSLMGVAMLQGFRYADADGAWTNGTIYDPQNGKTYSCTLRLKSANALEVRGYVGVSLFGRTEVWTRLPQ